MEKLELKNELVVKKSEQLVYGKYKLSATAQKLVTTVVSLVQKEDEYNKEYCILAKDFIELSGTKTNDRDALKNACEEILSKPLKISTERGWLMANWCNDIEYVHEKGIITYKVSEKLKPYIIDLKNNYLKYDLKNILPLKSEYSIRVYEWLKDIYNTKQRYNKKIIEEFEIDFLRERLIVPSSYNFGMMKDRVIEKAKQDLEKHTDIRFTYQALKKGGGNTFTHIEFTISKNFDVLEEMEKIEQLPHYLQSYLNFVNKLRTIYKETSKYFMQLKIDLGDGDKSYFFGINKDDLIYAMPFDGGDSIQVSKAKAEIIYNSSYLTAQHSKTYRDFLTVHKGDFWDLAKDEESRDYYKSLATEISTVLKSNDPRIKPMF
jgi:plasmid replication initiation protein